MEITIEEALRQGSAALHQGRIYDAERFFRAIKNFRPEHAEANYNLGLIAVLMHKNEAAKALFKTALGSNPNTEKFWVSYVEVLLKASEFENAKYVIRQAIKHGVNKEKLIVLEAKLALATQANETQLALQNKNVSLSNMGSKLIEETASQKMSENLNLNSGVPPQQKLSNLLKYFQSGRLDKAEKLARLIVQKYPDHQFAWKVLGSVLVQFGRTDEAVLVKERAISLAPNDAEAHSNLGNTLHILGRLDDAEARCRRAIALRTDFAEAHSNLGNTLKERGKLDQAEACYQQAITLKPDLAEAYYNLGNMLQERGKLVDSEISYNQAIFLKPHYAKAHYNLGTKLKERKRIEEAEANLQKWFDKASNFEVGKELISMQAATPSVNPPGILD